jgi:hypothetical protein
MGHTGCGSEEKAVVCFRKRYPTLIDDKTVDESGAPGTETHPITQTRYATSERLGATNQRLDTFRKLPLWQS